MNAPRTYRSARKSGFTLVEILIVVIILGILAAIVIPQFTNASTSARQNSLTSQLQTIRSQVELYKIQHNDMLPLDGDGAWSWSMMTSKTNADGTTTGTPSFGPYLQSTPSNSLNSFTAVGTAPAASTGWVFDAATGKFYATGLDPTKWFNETSPAGADLAAKPF
jgi:general secretion pathway protein G